MGINEEGKRQGEGAVSAQHRGKRAESSRSRIWAGTKERDTMWGQDREVGRVSAEDQSEAVQGHRRSASA